ncbi:MAG: inorganic phosphate transporter [Gammaproteobacteria bacterium]|nr:MAG: inorganic phosphate transporter [Gammaproteobacteria bacterium]
MEILSQHGELLLILACVFGFFMAWGVGANDVANAMGTSVGSKALTVRQAIFIAMIFEFLGAYLAGGSVTDTIRKGIIAPEAFTNAPDLLVFGMMASLLAAGTWLLLASMMGWPVSTTHSIVGAIVGFVAAGMGMDAVNWDAVTEIVSSWVVSPIMAGIISFGLFMSVQKLILTQKDPFARAKKLVPVYMFFVGLVVGMVTILKGLKYVLKDHHVDFTFMESIGLACLVGLVVAAIGALLLSRIQRDPIAEQDSRFASVEKIFAVLMVFTACAMAFAHGSNDVANAVGPLAAIVSVIESGGEVARKAALPGWILLLGAGGIVFGLATYGFRVIATVGKKITELTPSRGFAAELGAATTVVVASGTGLPISTTHTLVGAILGVGLARGISALNLRTIGSIFMSWIITLPAGAGLAIVFFFMFKGMFM